MTAPPSAEETIRKAILKVAELYALSDAEVGVTLTDDAYIRELNRTYRDKDSATDVLSFALNEGDEPDVVGGPKLNLLGDIVISMETARRQADEYGHGVERETAYLAVHAMLHLLGYDHIEGSDRLEMRKEEEYVLERLGIGRV